MKFIELFILVSAEYMFVIMTTQEIDVELNSTTSKKSNPIYIVPEK